MDLMSSLRIRRHLEVPRESFVDWIVGLGVFWFLWTFVCATGAVESNRLSGSHCAAETLMCDSNSNFPVEVEGSVYCTVR